jgi:hypothetical protein
VQLCPLAHESIGAAGELTFDQVAGSLFANAIEKGATVLAAILAAGATVAGAFVVRYWDGRRSALSRPLAIG